MEMHRTPEADVRDENRGEARRSRSSVPVLPAISVFHGGSEQEGADQTFEPLGSERQLHAPQLRSEQQASSDRGSYIGQDCCKPQGRLLQMIVDNRGCPNVAARGHI